MPTTTIRVDADLLRRIESKKPNYISTTGFFQLLAERALDTDVTLGARPAGAGSLFLSSKAVNKEEKDVDFQLRAEEANVPAEVIRATQFAATVKEQAKGYSPSFEAFWKIYQSCPDTLRVRSQTKRKAFDCWNDALKVAPADDLIRAAEIAVQGQLDLQRAGEWAASLPDAFRWLKDGKYEALLEDHQPAQAQFSGDRL